MVTKIEKCIVNLHIVYYPKDLKVYIDNDKKQAFEGVLLNGLVEEEVTSEPVKIKQNSVVEHLFQGFGFPDRFVTTSQEIYELLRVSCVGSYSLDPYTCGIEADVDNLGLSDTFIDFLNDKDFLNDIIKYISERDSLLTDQEMHFQIPTMWNYVYEQGFEGDWDTYSEFLGFLDINSIKVIENDKQNKERIEEGREKMST